MLRPTKEQIDEQIVDLAARLFAQHGFRQTSIQAIADAAGYSKAGILNRFPTKEALQDAVVDRCLRGATEVVQKVETLIPGAERDLATVTALVEFSTQLPGCLALMLSGVGPRSDEELSRLDPFAHLLFAAFSVDESSDEERMIRIGSALGALAVTSLGIQNQNSERFGELRHLVIQASFDALGHNLSTSFKEN